MLQGFNAWDLPYTNLLNPETQTIHGMFEHWAKHTSEAPALTFGVSIVLILSAFPCVKPVNYCLQGLVDRPASTYMLRELMHGDWSAHQAPPTHARCSRLCRQCIIICA